MGFSRGLSRRGMIVVVMTAFAWSFVGASAAPRKAEPGPKKSDKPIPTANLTVSEVSALQERLRERDAMAVDFTQERYLALRNKTRQSAGRALFAKPGRFRWSIDTPKREEWIYDGSSLYYFLPSEKQLTRYPAGAGESRQLREIVGAVMDFGELLRRYEVAEARRVGEEVVLTLRPKQVMDIRAIELRVVERENRIAFVKLFMGDDYNAITFSPPKEGKPIPSDFSPPPGVKAKDM